ncbi:MAG: engB [Chlamydiales bacterium]|jgi:GTP-binding protein|nr:engB [Chlamydiales bacterium]
MKPLTLQKARFLTSAVEPKGFPYIRAEKGEAMLEIAIVGRSNVGKSSLINHLFGNKTLAKTSSTPGKTQLINFFVADECCLFVDLPGYGYAAVPLEVKKQWGPMIESYLKERPSLKLILMLLDIRRIPNEEDIQLVEWLEYYQKKVIFVLTKTDKVNQKEKDTHTKQIFQALNYNDPCYVHYSALKNKGRDQLVRLINSSLELT